MLAAVTLALVGVAVVAPAEAQAATSCGPYVQVHSTHYNDDAEYCAIWGAPVPVYGFNNGLVTHTVVGYLYNGGSTNWFICSKNDWTYYHGGYSSPSWAYTYADDGQRGFVSGVYFNGPQNYFPGLNACV